MSVAVVITYRNEGATGPTYLPVATEDVFAAYWLPAAAQLGLKWVPLFQTGTTVAVEDFAEVLGEFERLHDYFARSADETEIVEHLRERSLWVTAELARLDPAAIRDLFVG